MSDLADYFRAQAAWRRSVAETYPDDPRNLQSAAALDALADWVEPDEHGDYEAPSVLDDLEPFLVDLSLGGDETARAVSRYGYGYNVISAHHIDFLNELVALCLIDAYSYAAENGGDDPTGTLFPFECDAARDGVVLPDRYFELRRGSLEHELEDVVASYAEADEV